MLPKSTSADMNVAHLSILVRDAVIVAMSTMVLAAPSLSEPRLHAQTPAVAARGKAARVDAERSAHDVASTLSPLETRGRDTWFFWTAGNEHHFRSVAILSDGNFDLLKVIDSRRSGRRFRTLGLITDPGCTPASHADEYGLWLDQCAPDNIPDIPGAPT